MKVVCCKLYVVSCRLKKWTEDSGERIVWMELKKWTEDSEKWIVVRCESACRRQVVG